MGFTSEIKDTTKGPHATGALYILVIGLALSDILPTPADYFVFKKEKSLRDEWKNHQISPEEFWKQQAWAYYGYNFIYWIIVGAIIVLSGGSARHKLYIAGAIIGGGAVIGVIAKNIQQDKLDLAKELADTQALEEAKNKNVVK